MEDIGEVGHRSGCPALTLERFEVKYGPSEFGEKNVASEKSEHA